jgi:hypothetical protein
MEKSNVFNSLSQAGVLKPRPAPPPPTHTQLPNLKLILRKAESGSYCKAEPTTLQFAPGGGNGTAVAGGWFRVSVPTAAFNCGGGGVRLADVTQLDFQNAQLMRNAIVCLGDVELVR